MKEMSNQTLEMVGIRFAKKTKTIKIVKKSKIGINGEPLPI